MAIAPSEKILHRKKEGILLFITVLIAIASLILANYYTLKVSNSIRAYVQGESEYSKGQKNACINLILYAETGDSKYFELFQKETEIPHNDGLALKKLMSSNDSADNDEIRGYFLKGNNHPRDIKNLIWLFRNFRHFGFMGNAIEIWSKADTEIDVLIEVGEEMSQPQIITLILSDREKQKAYIGNIQMLSQQINKRELHFSNVLGETSRTMNSVLFWVNILMITFIFAMLAWFFRRVMRDIKGLNSVLQIKNASLTETNQKLDQFIYATSHDLKAPVNNMQGLVNVARMHPEDLNSFQESVLDKMEISLQSLAGTMQDIENMIRIDRDPYNDFEEVNIDEMLNLILLDSQIVKESEDFEVVRKLQNKTIYFSMKGMTSILHNLIYNAVKYRSFDRKLSIIIESIELDNGFVLTIEDNGLGIDLDKYGDVIYDMFWRFKDNVDGSGLGLYIVRRILERNGGNISVESKPGEGTTFRLFFIK